MKQTYIKPRKAVLTTVTKWLADIKLDFLISVTFNL